MERSDRPVGILYDLFLVNSCVSIYPIVIIVIITYGTLIA